MSGELPMAEVLAVVNGERLTQLPTDLYIPPQALAVYLDTFEGPLDLLLYLIRRHHLDVLDIPMAELTAQYMTYVTLMRCQQLELAAEYMLMAVWLIEIKSRLLLPRPILTDAADQDHDPRATLVRRLLEYEQMRLAAQTLEALPRLGRDYVAALVYHAPLARRQPQLCADDLQQAWLILLARQGTRRHHAVGRRELSVREAMGQILDSLQGDLFIEFSSFLAPAATLSQWVVNFLAILELAREKRLEIIQNMTFAPIYMRLSSGRVDVA